MALAFPVYEVSRPAPVPRTQNPRHRLSTNNDCIRITSSIEVTSSDRNGTVESIPEGFAANTQHQLTNAPSVSISTRAPSLNLRRFSSLHYPKNKSATSKTSSPQPLTAGPCDLPRVETSVTSGFSTCNTENTWQTSSSNSRNAWSTSHSSSGKAVSIMSAKTTDTFRVQSKVKIFDMLSAVDRRKKKTFSEQKNNQSVAAQAPSPDAATPAQDPKAIRSPPKLQPRGAASREDCSELREFLENERANTPDREHVFEPKSHFEWLDSDDERPRQNKSSTTTLRALARAPERQAPTSGNVNNAGDERLRKNNNSNIKVEALVRVPKRRVMAEGDGDDGAARTANWTNGLGNIVDDWIKDTEGYMRREGKNAEDLVDDVDGSEFSAFLAENSTPRRSVLKVFDDPMWRDREQDLAADLGNKNSLVSSPTWVTIRELNPFSDPEMAQAEDRVDTTADIEDKDGDSEPLQKPKLTTSPSKNNIGIGGFSNTDMSGEGFRTVEWNRYGRGMSAIHAPECAPGAPPLPQINGLENLEDDEQPSDKPAKLSMLKKFSSTLKLNTEKANEATLADGLRSPNGSHTPKHPTKLRHQVGTSCDPFLDGACQEVPQKPGNLKDDVLARDQARRLNAGTGSPTRETRRFNQSSLSPHASKWYDSLQAHEQAELPLIGNRLAGNSDSPVSPSFFKSSLPQPSPEFRFPDNPDHPDWDRAVEYARRLLKEDERKQIEAVRQERRQLRAEEKGLKKFRAGKDLTNPESQPATYRPTRPARDNIGYDFGSLEDTKSSRAEVCVAKEDGEMDHLTTGVAAYRLEKKRRAEEILRTLAKHRSPQVLHGRQDPAVSVAEEARVGLGISAGISTGASLTAIFEEESPDPRDVSPDMPGDPTSTTFSTKTSSWATSMGTDPKSGDTSSTPGTSSGFSSGKVDEMQTFQGISAPWQADTKDFPPQVDRYLKYEGQSAVPAPLRIYKALRNGIDDDASVYSNDADAGAFPAPLSVSPSVLSVRRSSSKLLPVASNSFSPRRDSTFIRKIEEASELKRTKLSDHPALRSSVNDDNIVALPSRSKTAGRPEQQSRAANDKGLVGEWRARCLSTDGSEPVANYGIATLRAEMGMEHLRLRTSSSPAHPNHLFTWNHDKIMCRQVHNPAQAPLAKPRLQVNGSLDMNRKDSQFFKPSSIGEQVVEARMCDICGSFCCRFVKLFVQSSISSNGDILEEMVRRNAEHRVDVLKVQYPNGIEEYETFLTCAQCSRKVCPKCAAKCNDSLCQSVVCNSCSAGAEMCPVHNVI